jgi:nucleoside diphosphate kinase
VTSSTANKLVAFFAIGGVAYALWTGKDASSRYKHVWGVTLLAAAGAVLADFAPKVVGPFFGLVVIAALAGRSADISGIASGIRKQATSKGTT